jgi:maspardin
MRKKYTYRLIWIAAAIIIIYVFPSPQKTFNGLYHGYPSPQVDKLYELRALPLSTLEVDGEEWSYLSIGKGKRTVLFLHGMAGAYDIWWNQIDALKDSFNIISITYPPVGNLADMGKAAVAILDKEKIEKVNVVGTSLGGYFAQYLVANYPNRVERAVFGNTFPPNNIIEKENKANRWLMRLAPHWAVMSALRANIKQKVIPPSGNNEVLKAYLQEGTYRTSRKQLLARYNCVIDKFNPAANTTIPILIIESNNDPLISVTLRASLKKLYPTAQVVNFGDEGHMPYVNKSKEYSEVLKEFLR